jgi:hypothetical protein
MTSSKSTAASMIQKIGCAPVLRFRVETESIGAKLDGMVVSLSMLISPWWCGHSSHYGN